MGRKKTGSKKGGQRQATVKVIPVQGSSTERSVDIPKGGLTAGDALKALGISAERKNLSINGKSAKADQKIAAGDTLQVEERPQGS